MFTRSQVLKSPAARRGIDQRDDLAGPAVSCCASTSSRMGLPRMVACSGPTAAVFTSPPRCGRCCRRPVRRRSLLLWLPRHWPASRMTSVMLGSRGGLTPVLPARRWPSGQVTARECPTGSTRTASTGTTSGGTSGWRTSLASLESGSGFRVPALSRADLDRCRRAHCAYIPGLATSGGLGGTWLHGRSAEVRSFPQLRPGLVWSGWTLPAGFEPALTVPGGH
jgi:hypothetical protein